MFRVFKQFDPIATNQSFRQVVDGKVIEGFWHRACLVEIGFARTWEEAKALTTAPIVEEVKHDYCH